MLSWIEDVEMNGASHKERITNVTNECYDVLRNIREQQETCITRMLRCYHLTSQTQHHSMICVDLD